MIWLMWYGYITWMQYLGAVIVFGFVWANAYEYKVRPKSLHDFRFDIGVGVFTLLLWPLVFDFALIGLPIMLVVEFVKWADPTKRMYKNLEELPRELSRSRG